jgi:hypothetical protein
VKRHLATSALLALLGPACADATAGPWVLDRGAGELVRLEPTLVVRARIALRSPRALVGGSGGVWVASEDEQAALGTRLEFLGERGARRSHGFGALHALAADGRGAALVLVDPRDPRGDERFLYRVESSGARTLLGAFPGASAIAAHAGEVLVGTPDGALACLDARGAVRTLGTLAGGVRALAQGPRPGDWWVLDARGGLTLLGPTLEPRAALASGLDAEGFAPVPGEERVWIAAGARVRRYGPGGALELERALPGSPWRAAAAHAAGVWLVARGAVLELDVHGRVRRSQGGFDEILGIVGSVSAGAGATRPPAASSRRARPRAPAPAAGS